MKFLLTSPCLVSTCNSFCIASDIILRHRFLPGPDFQNNVRWIELFIALNFHLQDPFVFLFLDALNMQNQHDK